MSPWERGAFGRTETPDQALAMAEMYRRGTSARSIAQMFGLNVRTVYRAISRADREHVWIECGAWRAQFAMTEAGPVQVCGWLPNIGGRNSGTTTYRPSNATPEDGGAESPHRRSHRESSHPGSPNDVQRHRHEVASRGAVRSDA